MIDPAASAESHSPQQKKNVGYVLFKILIICIIFYFIFRNNDWGKFAQEMMNAQPAWLIIAFASTGLGIASAAVRWRFLLRVQGIAPSYANVLVYNMIGVFFNQFLPASTGGDLVKIYYLTRAVPTKKAAATLSIMLDRVLGLLAVLLFTLMLVPLEYRAIAANAETRVFISTLAIVLMVLFVGLLTLWVTPLKCLPNFFSAIWNVLPKRDILASVYDAFQAHKRSPKITFSACIAALFTVVPILSCGYFTARALSLDVSYPQMTILFSLVICSMSLPFSLGGHGLREGAFILLFQIFQITRDGRVVGIESATACATLVLAVSMIWSLIGGLVFLFFTRGQSHSIGLSTLPK